LDLESCFPELAGSVMNRVRQGNCQCQ
jgi:hypothetical protein